MRPPVRARTLLFLTGLWIAATTLVLVLTALTERREVENRLTQAVHMAGPTVADSLATGDWLPLYWLARSLGGDEVQDLTIEVEGSKLRWTAPAERSACLVPVAVSVVHYGVLLAHVSACLSWRSLAGAALSNVATWVMLAALGVLVGVAAAWPLNRYRARLKKALDVLRRWADAPDGGAPAVEEGDAVLREVCRLIEGGVGRARAAESQLSRRRNAWQMAELALQVAHDIRSPLAVLDMVARRAESVPSEQRQLLNLAIGRINDIARVLLSRHRNAQGGQSADEAPRAVGALAALENAMTEVRARHGGRRDLAWTLDVEPEGRALFLRAGPSELQRVLVNLLNNAVEAMAAAGSITVALSATRASVCVAIKDTGKGIAPELLSKLGVAGATYDKPGGTGLGLAHARQCASRWGGTLRLASTLGCGAQVYLALSRCPAPPWFVPRLEIVTGSQVWVVDDDESIHETWRLRLAPYVAREAITLRHAGSAEEVLAAPRNVDGPTLCLLDQQLGEGRLNGLELVTRLKGRATCILVTSRADETALQDQGVERGLQILAKSCIPRLAIHVAPGELRVAVLIDDDPLVQQLWAMQAAAAGMQLAGFERAHAFLAQADAYSRATPVYLDYQLAAGEDARSVADRLAEMGFVNLYFATGRVKESIPPHPAVRDVLGKSPPATWDAR